MQCPKCNHIFHPRTDMQNRMYWALVIEPMARAAGCSSDEMHEVLKNELLMQQLALKTKDGIEFKHIVGSTTKLATEEFCNYVEQCAEIAARVYGLEIKNPYREKENEKF